MRISSLERERNAREFYRKYREGDHTKVSVVVNRAIQSEDLAELSVNPCQFVVPYLEGASTEPAVIAESPLGVPGCFQEFIENICLDHPEIQERRQYGEPKFGESGFKAWLEQEFQLRISYEDELVFIFER